MNHKNTHINIFLLDSPKGKGREGKATLHFLQGTPAAYNHNNSVEWFSKSATGLRSPSDLHGMWVF